MTSHEAYEYAQQLSNLGLREFPKKSEPMLRWISQLLLPLTSSQAEGILATLGLLRQFGFAPKFDCDGFERCVTVRPLSRQNVLWAYTTPGRWNGFKWETGQPPSEWPKPLCPKCSSLGILEIPSSRVVPITYCTCKAGIDRSESEDSGPSLPPAA